MSSAGLSPWSQSAGVVFASIAGVYAAFVIACSIAATRSDLRCGLALAAVFPILHFSYGIGFIRGIYDHILVRNVPPAGEIGLSR
jgi:hypothetical protein